MNLNDTDYFNKYLKYKSKYNTLKIQLSGQGGKDKPPVCNPTECRQYDSLGQVIIYDRHQLRKKDEICVRCGCKYYL
jgi:hypothetical protein